MSTERHTSLFANADRSRNSRLDNVSTARAYSEIVNALESPTFVLNRAGIVLATNQAACERLRAVEQDIVGEPLLTWFFRASETEAFGQAFMGLRKRSIGHRFTLEMNLMPKLGPPITCIVRGCKLTSENSLISCDPAIPVEYSPEIEINRAVTRSLEALDQGMLLIDAHGRIVHANPAAKTLLGTSLIGRSFLELANPASLDSLSRALLLASAGNWHGELEVCTLKGEPIPIELSLAASRGEGALTVALFRNLQTRRLRQFEERLIAQVDRQLVSSPRPQENIPAACNTLMEALEIRHVYVLVKMADGWECWRIRKGGSLEIVSLAKNFQPAKAWADGSSVEPLEVTDPTLIQVYKQHRHPHTAFRVILRAPSGIVGYLLLISSKLQGLETQEQSLLTMLARQLGLSLANGLLVLETEALASYQSMVLNQTTVMLNSIDANGRVYKWNRASEQLLGIAQEDACGKLFGLEVARLTNPTRWQELWLELLKNGFIASEIAVFDDSGTEIPLHLEGRLLRDKDRIHGAVLVGLDLRHRRKLEDQVLKSHKLAAVGLLAAGIAHELNNPLSGVVGYSKLLLEQNLPPKVIEMIEKIAISGERCQKIVEGILLFSRQQETNHRNNIDLCQLIQRVVAIGEYQWRIHNVRMIRELPQEPVMIHADADQLEQMLLNLLSNAVDSMPRGGSVRISLNREDNGSIRLDVSDQGHGIPEEIRSRIFDPFFSTKEIGKGTGLGLAISYGIIKDHGGDILLHSIPGKGSTFSVILPPEGPRKTQPTQQQARALPNLWEQLSIGNRV